MIVRFRFPDGEEVEVEGYEQLNILAHAQLVERSLQSRCGGHCDCGTCRVVVVEGNLSPMRAEERELLARVGVTDPTVRLACQSFPEKCDLVTIKVPSERFIDARAKRKR